MKWLASGSISDRTLQRVPASSVNVNVVASGNPTLLRRMAAEAASARIIPGAYRATALYNIGTVQLRSPRTSIRVAAFVTCAESAAPGANASIISGRMSRSFMIPQPRSFDHPWAVTDQPAG